ncbi:type II secretion system F family protein [bacterium]|nr:type II secretion system F family protein [bacterium]
MDTQLIGSNLLNHSPPLALARRGYKLAKYCLIAQLMLFFLGIVLVNVDSEDPAMQILYQLVCLLFPLADLLMWAGLFAPVVYNWVRGRTDSADQLLIIGQLAELLRLGMPVPEALEMLSRHQRSSWRSRFSHGCQSLEFMSRTTAHGDRLGQAMDRFPFFPPHWAGLLNAAEIRGVLVEVLEDLETGRTRQAWFSIWFGLRLMFIWLVSFPIALFLVTYILPTFVALFEGMSLTLPLATRVFIACVKFARSPLGTLIFVGVPLGCVAVALWAHYKPEFGGRMRAFLYRLPPFSLVLPLEDQAAVATTLATCLQLGLAEGEALQVGALSTQHPAYVSAMRGQAGIHEALDRHPELFAPPLRWLAAQGQRHGNLEEALSCAAVYLLDLAEEKKVRWSVWLDTLAACGFGALTLGLVLATMMPLGLMISGLLEQVVLP